MSHAIQNTPTPQMLTTLPLTPTDSASEQQTELKENQSTSDEKEIVMSASMFLPDMKHEARKEINETSNFKASEPEISNGKISPKIRVTPTCKLLPTPNPVDPKRKFICPYENCTKSYGKSSHLRSHLTWHTGIKPFVCPEPLCGKGFTRSDELNRHVRTHTGEKPFECVQCTKKFSRSDHLTKHLATHERQLKTPTKRPAKNVSGKSTVSTKKPNTSAGTDFNSESEYERENETHRFETIHVHGMGIPGLTMLSENNEPHMEEQTEETVNSRNHENRKFNGNGNRSHKKHRSSVKSEPTDDIMELPQLPPTDGSNTYGIPQFLEDGLDQERPFICKDCQKRFKRQDDLNRHYRTHTGEKPYACSECERRFLRSDHLKNHQLTHNRKR